MQSSLLQSVKAVWICATSIVSVGVSVGTSVGVFVGVWIGVSVAPSVASGSASPSASGRRGRRRHGGCACRYRCTGGRLRRRFVLGVLVAVDVAVLVGVSVGSPSESNTWAYVHLPRPR